MFSGWKTITFNILASVIPMMELTEFREVIPVEYLPMYSLAIVLANLVLRHMTTSPVGYRND